MKKIRVRLSTRSLHAGHTFRGVGVYTRNLQFYLSQLDQVELVAENEKPDLIHYPYFDFFFVSLPFHVFSKAVVTIHDTIPLIYPKHYPAGVRGQLNLIRQKLALRFVKAIITDSQSSKHDIATYLEVPAQKIWVVPLAADERFIPQDEKYVQKIRRQYKLPKNYLLYVGDINYNKNLTSLIKVLKFLPSKIKLVCIGRNFKPQPIPEWRAIETQLALSDVRERVIFLNEMRVDAIQPMAAIYSGALAYVQASLYEGFGLPVLEAMQSGTLVVASNTSSLPEVLGEVGFQVEPTTEGLLAGVKEALSLSKTKREAMIKAGLKRAKQFSWEQVAKNTLKVYEKI